MHDLCMCASTECPKQWECYRAMAKPNLVQSYAEFYQKGKECEMFIDVKEKE